jgi:hypothetical protein
VNFLNCGLFKILTSVQAGGETLPEEWGGERKIHTEYELNFVIENIHSSGIRTQSKVNTSEKNT